MQFESATRRPGLRWREAAWLAWVVVVVTAADAGYAWERLRWISGDDAAGLDPAALARRTVFLLEHVLAAVAVVACSRLGRRGWVPLGLFALFLWVDLAAHAALGRPAGLSNIAVLQAAAGQLPHAVREFFAATLAAGAWAGLLLLPLALRAGTQAASLRARWAAVPVGVLLLAYAGTLWVRGEQALIGFPKGFAYAFGAGATALDEGLQALRGQPPVEVPLPAPADTAQQVVLVIDESIRHDVFARHFGPHPQAVDYGLARSAANCSAASNYVLRKAGWVRGPQAAAPVRPYESLFSLARRAGYRTAYIDNQGVLADPAARNYFDQAEVALIDEIVRPLGAAHLRDPASLQALARLLAQPGRLFVVVNKVGAHFPYAEMVPPDLRQADRLAAYDTAVRVNAADYLERLARHMRPGTLVFYTADHGQDLQARAPHCNTGGDISPDEFAVPFLVLAGDPARLQALRALQPQLEGRLSHLEVAESVRRALGYRFEGVDAVFEPPRHLAHDLCAIHGPPKPFFGVGPRCLLLPGPGAS